MKHLDNRMILLLFFPPVFAVLFLLFLYSPLVSPELSTTLSLPFVLPFVLIAILFLPLFLWVFHGQVYIVVIFLFALLCVTVEYFYWRLLQRGQRGERIPLVVATYLLISLLFGMVTLFPSIGQGCSEGVQLTLSKVDKNETFGPLIHFTPQNLVESPALKSLIESGHTSMSDYEYGSFQQRYPPGYFVEYNGTYYKLTRRVPQCG